MFESYVILYTTKTIISFSVSLSVFESYVILYTTKTMEKITKTSL